MKEVKVISLGGSLVAQDKIQKKYIKKFARLLQQFKKYKFIVVVGGGKTARTYINAVTNKSEKQKALLGIQATRLNARLVTYFIKNCNTIIPSSIKEVKELLKKHNIVVCGGLQYKPNNTSDGTSAELASKFKSEFYNLTNIDGLYSANPLTNKHAKFIPYESFTNFYKRVKKLPFKAGQHFVLDQHAAKIIKKERVRTYILNGKKLGEVKKCLQKKRFRGTIIDTKP